MIRATVYKYMVPIHLLLACLYHCRPDVTFTYRNAQLYIETLSNVI